MPRIRQIGEDELERLVTVQNSVWTHDVFVPSDYVDWRRQADEMVWLLASDEAGVDVGAGVGVHGWHSPPGVGRVSVFVQVAARGRGVGTGLLAKLGRWLAGHGCSEADAKVREDDPASLAWALRRGFVEIGRSSMLALDLDTVRVPDVTPPTGIEILTWAERPGLERGMYEVYCEASPDIPGEDDTEISPLEEWLANDMQGLSDRPDATFVALAGDEVVGYAKLAISAGQGDVAWHDLTGVKRAWRGRGIATALKRTQIVWAKANGFRYLKTHNEERNEPVQRLNRGHGYRQEPGAITLRGAVGP